MTTTRRRLATTFAALGALALGFTGAITLDSDRAGAATVTASDNPSTPALPGSSFDPGLMSPQTSHPRIDHGFPARHHVPVWSRS